MRRSKPSGVTIARALRIGPGIANDDLREVVGAIERVHGDGDLPAIRLSLATDIIDPMGRTLDGLFAAERDRHGELFPRSIRIRINAPHRGFVVLHEIGHFVDAAGLPGAGYSSEWHRALTPWRRAIRRSQAFRELARLGAAVDPVTAARATSLLEPTELWARSYAQFAAGRSDSMILAESLATFRRQIGSSVYLPRQWDDDDFGAIDTAIEILFRDLGWMI
jgi:hypothetical protein